MLPSFGTHHIDEIYYLEGQQIGVFTKALENVVPCSARRFLVLTRGVMASRNTSWSSVNTMTMLGRVVEHLVRERMHNKGRKEIMMVMVHIHKSIGIH